MSKFVLKDCKDGLKVKSFKSLEKAKNYVTRYGGTITEVEEWGKKRLAYEVQKMREGFYYFIQFEADATCPAEVERHVRIMDNVMRYLVVKKEA